MKRLIVITLLFVVFGTASAHFTDSIKLNSFFGIGTVRIGLEEVKNEEHQKIFKVYNNGSISFHYFLEISGNGCDFDITIDRNDKEVYSGALVDFSGSKKYEIEDDFDEWVFSGIPEKECDTDLFFKAESKNFYYLRSLVN